MCDLSSTKKRIYLSDNIETKGHVPEGNKVSKKSNSEEGSISAKISISD